uniref:VQ domain-containing protein n=1 Tax=Oryza meridionalis TaxID=40149 RepID=A0A0E0DNA1_9ORYZ
MEEAKPMTVKYIVTRFVEADAAEFKSVVQSLTGKDSTAAMASPEEEGSRRRRTGHHRHVVPPAPRRWLRRNVDDGFLDVMPSIEEMDEFLRD